MHKCAKCGREAASLEEIDAGCPCGSKVFTFDRQAVQAAENEASANGNGLAAGASGGRQAAANGNGGNGSAQPDGNGKIAPDASGVGKDAPQDGDGKVPDSYFARTTFTDDDVENIKVLTQGVFLLDVNAISKNPVVLKDEDEIYYVKLPLEQKKIPEQEGNGKK